MNTCPHCQAIIETLPGFQAPEVFECPNCGTTFKVLALLGGERRAVIVALGPRGPEPLPQAPGGPDGQLSLFG